MVLQNVLVLPGSDAETTWLKGTEMTSPYATDTPASVSVQIGGHPLAVFMRTFTLTRNAASIYEPTVTIVDK